MAGRGGRSGSVAGREAPPHRASAVDRAPPTLGRAGRVGADPPRRDIERLVHSVRGGWLERHRRQRNRIPIGGKRAVSHLAVTAAAAATRVADDVARWRGPPRRLVGAASQPSRARAPVLRDGHRLRAGRVLAVSRHPGRRLGGLFQLGLPALHRNCDALSPRQPGQCWHPGARRPAPWVPRPRGDGQSSVWLPDRAAGDRAVHHTGREPPARRTHPESR